MMSNKEPTIKELSIQLLGKFQISINQTDFILQDDMKLNAVLAYLCFHRNQEVPRDTLLALFWPDYEESKARQNLRTLLSRVRKKFQPYTKQLLQANRQNITWTVPSHTEVDINLFEKLDSIEVSKLEASIQKTRFEFLMDIDGLNSPTFEEWLIFQRHTIRRQSVQFLKDSLLRLEKTVSFQRQLDICFAVLEQEPWEEGVNLRVMRLYHGNSMTVAAINQYKQFRKVLKREFSVAPSPEVESYYQLLLQEQNESSPSTSKQKEAFEPLETSLREGWFPTFSVPYVPVFAEQTTSILFREKEKRLVSLVGFGGIGKTRIACEVARRIKEDLGKDCFFLSYADFPDKTHATTKQLLLFTAEKLNQHLDYSMPLENQFFGFWKHREAFFVLDNFEAVLQGTDFLQQWMGHSTGSQFLVTSRAPLELQAEEVVSVEGFLVSEEGKVDPSRVSSSVDFFLSNVPEGTLGTFEDLPEQKQRQLEQICLRLGGHPVALENVAFWLEHFSLDEVEERLQSIDTNDIYSLSQNTKELFDYSWELLFSEQKHVLFQLSLLQGFFGSSLAQQLTKSSSFVLNSVTKSGWLKRSVHSDQYYFHDLFRQYISEKLEENEEEKNKCIQRFSSYFLEGLFEEHKDKSSRHQDILPIIEHHWSFFYQALFYVVEQENGDLLGTNLRRLYGYVEASHRTIEVESLLAKIKSHDEDSSVFQDNPDIREYLYLLRLQFERRQYTTRFQEFKQVIDDCPEDLSLSAKVELVNHKSFFLSLLGKRGIEREGLLKWILEYLPQLSDEAKGIVLVQKAEDLAFKQQLEDSKDILSQAYELLKEARSSHWLGVASLGFGNIALKEGRFLDAESYFQQHLLYSQTIPNPVSKSQHQLWTGYLFLLQRKPAARAYLNSAYQNYKDFGNVKYQGYALYLLACADRIEEKRMGAHEKIEQAIKMACQSPIFYSLLGDITRFLGRYALDEGKLEEAVGYFWQSLCLHARKRGRDPSDSFVLLAQLLHAYGHDEESFQVLSYLYSQEDFVQNPIFSDEIKDFAKQMFRCFTNEEKQPLLDEMESWTEHHLVEKALFFLPLEKKNEDACSSCLLFGKGGRKESNEQENA